MRARNGAHGSTATTQEEIAPMNDIPYQQRPPVARSAHDDERTNGLTRRTVLAGAAAVTAAATLAAVDTPAAAGSVAADSTADMSAFVVLSAALTGLPEAKLAPGFSFNSPKPPAPPNTDLSTMDPGSDPVDIKQEYFDWINKRRPAAFEKLLQIVRDNIKAPDRAKAIIDKVQFDDESKKDEPKRTPTEIEAKYLARSIVLMWYLGAWYDPDDLQAGSNDPKVTPNFEVISPKAYTQGWALKVAQAHPMGYSEMQFGYWTRPPNPRSDFTG
jgi:hypothetical protein